MQQVPSNVNTSFTFSRKQGLLQQIKYAESLQKLKSRGTKVSSNLQIRLANSA
jgi:hypothetical protein